MKHTLSVLVEDESGVLTRIAGLFARRGFNIESLAVGPAEQVGVSRITMVVPAEDKTIEQLTKQLYKLVNILRVQDISDVPCVERELMLLKVSTSSSKRSEILEIVQIFRVVIDNSPGIFNSAFNLSSKTLPKTSNSRSTVRVKACTMTL